jgi:hypothetical protein
MPTDGALATAAKTEISPGAERMRRSRDRRHSGPRCYTLQIREIEIDALIDLGLLSQAERNSRTAVAFGRQG